jgi:uncharacterized protein
MDRLADLNVVLALVDPMHQHHGTVRSWFKELPDTTRICLCRITQMGLLRLLSSKAVMGNNPLTLEQAWGIYASLLQHPKCIFINEPDTLTRKWMRLCLPYKHAPKVVTDAYLAAFAIEAGLVLTTLDKAFDKFPELSLEALQA